MHRKSQINSYQTSLYELRGLEKKNAAEQESDDTGRKKLHLSRCMANLALNQVDDQEQAALFIHRTYSSYVQQLVHSRSNVMSEVSHVLSTKKKERGIESTLLHTNESIGVVFEDLKDANVVIGKQCLIDADSSETDNENTCMELDDRMQAIQQDLEALKENLVPPAPRETTAKHVSSHQSFQDMKSNDNFNNNLAPVHVSSDLTVQRDTAVPPTVESSHFRHNISNVSNRQSETRPQTNMRARIYGVPKDMVSYTPDHHLSSSTRLDTNVDYVSPPQAKRFKASEVETVTTLSDSDGYHEPSMRKGDFQSARDKLAKDAQKTGRPIANLSNNQAHSEPPKRKNLGTMKRPKFIPPLIANKNNQQQENLIQSSEKKESPEVDPRLKHFDPKMIETIMSEVMENSPTVTWDDIAGLEHAKNSIREIVVWPMQRPDIFTGIRGPPKGLLLFGPPGTGKTLIGKCIASQVNATFFSISSSSLTSKWVGDGEKMVRALFAVARLHQPSVIFLDEIDSLLTQRTDGEQEATRRIKTEFLVQFDGCGTDSEDRILMIGATNRPGEIDEAARRRFRKKLYIPLPEAEGRRTIVKNLLRAQVNDLTEADLDEIVQATDGYSGSDMNGLVSEAALGPIRDIRDISTIAISDVRPIGIQDFRKALTQVRASVSQKDLDFYVKFDKEYGSKVL